MLRSNWRVIGHGQGDLQHAAELAQVARPGGVPGYPRLAQLWWQFIAEAASGDKTPQQALDGLAAAQDTMMGRLERSGVQGDCGPKLNESRDPRYWLDQPGAPKPKLANEKPKGETINYEELLKSWEQARN